jgi:hypothetical protein
MKRPLMVFVLLGVCVFFAVRAGSTVAMAGVGFLLLLFLIVLIRAAWLGEPEEAHVGTMPRSKAAILSYFGLVISASLVWIVLDATTSISGENAALGFVGACIAIAGSGRPRWWFSVIRNVGFWGLFRSDTSARVALGVGGLLLIAGALTL